MINSSRNNKNFKNKNKEKKMSKLFSKNTIVSCIYRDKLRVVEITGVRNLVKAPLEQENQSDNSAGSKYLYTVMCYEDGSFRTFYDTGMTEVVVLSNKDFTNGKLKDRFDRFKKEYDDKQERLHKEKIRKIEEMSIPVSGLSPQENADRLQLDDIRSDTRVEVVFYETDEHGRHKSRVAKYSSHNVEEGIMIVYHPGINTYSKIKTERVQALHILDENGYKTQPSPYEGLTLNPMFHIPEYEVENGYSDEFWSALNDFLEPVASAKLSHRTPKTYRFVFRGGEGYSDKNVFAYRKWSDGKNIEITLCANGRVVRPVSIAQIQDIIQI
jgi:hypothetical protein